MKRIKQYLPAILAALLIGGVSLAQQEVQMQGQDSTGTVRYVLVDSSGRIVTTADTTSATSGTAVAAHGACTNTTMNVGTTGTACPATAMATRRSLFIQLVQAGETLTVTTDGSTAATATVGAQVSSGDAYADTLAGSVNANCRCTAATCSVRIVECP